MRMPPLRLADYSRSPRGQTKPEMAEGSLLPALPRQGLKGFEAGEKYDGMKELVVQKFLGRGFVSIF